MKTRKIKIDVDTPKALAGISTILWLVSIVVALPVIFSNRPTITDARIVSAAIMYAAGLIIGLYAIYKLLKQYADTPMGKTNY